MKYLEKSYGGRGILLGGVPGVERGKIVIIGGGVAGTYAVTLIGIIICLVIITGKSAIGGVKKQSGKAYNKAKEDATVTTPIPPICINKRITNIIHPIFYCFSCFFNFRYFAFFA